MRRVHRRARALGVAVCFITSRGEHLRAATERNLQAAGCTGHLARRMRPDGWHGPMASSKSAERRQPGQAGYTGIASIGDQAGDPGGGAAERTFKLPSPFYPVPWPARAGAARASGMHLEGEAAALLVERLPEAA